MLLGEEGKYAILVIIFGFWVGYLIFSWYLESKFVYIHPSCRHILIRFKYIFLHIMGLRFIHNMDDLILLMETRIRGRRSVDLLSYQFEQTSILIKVCG